MILPTDRPVALYRVDGELPRTAAGRGRVAWHVVHTAHPGLSKVLCQWGYTLDHDPVLRLRRSIAAPVLAHYQHMALVCPTWYPWDSAWDGTVFIAGWASPAQFLEESTGGDRLTLPVMRLFPTPAAAAAWGDALTVTHLPPPEGDPLAALEVGRWR